MCVVVQILISMDPVEFQRRIFSCYKARHFRLRFTTIAMAPVFLFALLSLLSTGSSLTSATAVDNVPRSSLAPEATSALSFASSKWIWNSATATANAVIGLRKDFTPPLGKALIGAEIIITAVSNLNLYVNGDYVGSGTPPSRGRFAHRFCVDLLPSFNVFAVNASTGVSGADEGGLLATILLTYTDGTTDRLITDSSWRVKSGLPLGWEQLSFDDTTWAVATTVGSYGVAPWDTVLVNIPADPPVLALDRAQWVWTDVIPASGSIPAGQRAFRRIFPLSPGQVSRSATIIIAADNEYTLYINGVSVGTGTNWKVAQRYTVNFASPPTEVVIGVLATQTAAGAAGFVLAMELNMVPSGRANCTAGAFLLTDAGWKSTKGAIPAGFEQPGFDDSSWPAVVAEATYPNAPWGAITVPTASAPSITI
ncbi:hypothetical protein DFH08DRAFT_877527 [Mycena albidolilacea]|uniref:Lectin n=1 Tax=Mycena albidolilacea TaxID=1033008 RepID=A0AAD6ZTH3_9AGAR|nr:hypothetical protein DFH08DRAFT_877527 [Mycena albidolilacea]